MRAVKCLLFVIVICVAAGSALVWSGIYNIAATEPHAGLTLWLMAKIRDRSIAAHSKGMQVVRPDTAEALDLGFEHYHGMCRLCHGAPGLPRSEFAEGLYPAPPDLSSPAVQAQSDAELYWVLQNGIKMSGMPAFGASHSQSELLALLAFLRRVPGTQLQDYNAIIERMEESGEEDHHHESHSGNEPSEPTGHSHDDHQRQGLSPGAAGR